MNRTNFNVVWSKFLTNFFILHEHDNTTFLTLHVFRHTLYFVRVTFGTLSTTFRFDVLSLNVTIYITVRHHRVSSSVPLFQSHWNSAKCSNLVTLFTIHFAFRTVCFKHYPLSLFPMLFDFFFSIRSMALIAPLSCHLNLI